MKVQEFRDIISHLCRIHNVDRHACVSVREAQTHIQIAERVYKELERATAEVKRAKPKDRERAGDILGTVRTWLINHAADWANHKDPKFTTKKSTPATRDDLKSLTSYLQAAAILAAEPVTMEHANQWAAEVRISVDHHDAAAALARANAAALGSLIANLHETSNAELEKIECSPYYYRKDNAAHYITTFSKALQCD